jgi:hypothetical protein
VIAEGKAVTVMVMMVVMMMVVLAVLLVVVARGAPVPRLRPRREGTSTRGDRACRYGDGQSRPVTFHRLLLSAQAATIVTPEQQ